MGAFFLLLLFVVFLMRGNSEGGIDVMVFSLPCFQALLKLLLHEKRASDENFRAVVYCHGRCVAWALVI